MSQHDYNIANATFPSTRSDINDAFGAIKSNNSGAAAPASTGAYLFWADTTTGLMKQRNAADNAWVSLWTLATGAPVTLDIVNDTTPQLGGQLDVNGQALGDGTLELLTFSETALAVNQLEVKNAATGTAPRLTATGDDTNVSLELDAKGTGVIKPLQAVVDQVVALTDAATIATDASLGNVFTVTLGGNRTLGAPTNPTNGQKIIYQIKQDATGSRTLGYNAVFRFGTDVASPTLTTTASKTDYLGFIYSSADTKWDCLAVAKGY